MTQALRIVRVTSQSSPLVLEIVQDAARWLDSQGVRQWQEMLDEAKARWIVEKRFKEGEVFLAYEGDEAVGTLTLQWEDDFWGELGRDPGAGYLHTMAVRRSAAGRQVGRRMLDWSVDYIKQAGRGRTRLDCAAENAKLCAFYEGSGFKRIGSMDWKGLSLALMEKLAACLCLLLFACACNSSGPAASLPQAQPTVAAATPTPRPLPRAKARPTQVLVIETPVPEAELEPSPTAEMSLLPSDKHLLEEVAFKKQEEVRDLLGEPDGRYLQGKLLSWYYLRQEKGSEGKKVCPEVQFFDGSARFVIFWTPEAMRGKIALAGRHAGVEPGAGHQASYAFVDSFRYLAVGTPQEAVLADLGEPDGRLTVEGAEEWDYDTLIVENGAARRLTVVIKEGKVSEIRGR